MARVVFFGFPFIRLSLVSWKWTWSRLCSCKFVKEFAAYSLSRSAEKWDPQVVIEQQQDCLAWSPDVLLKAECFCVYRESWGLQNCARAKETKSQAWHTGHIPTPWPSGSKCSRYRNALNMSSQLPLLKSITWAYRLNSDTYLQDKIFTENTFRVSGRWGWNASVSLPDKRNTVAQRCLQKKKSN